MPGSVRHRRGDLPSYCCATRCQHPGIGVHEGRRGGASRHRAELTLQADAAAGILMDEQQTPADVAGGTLMGVQTDTG